MKREREQQTYDVDVFSSMCESLMKEARAVHFGGKVYSFPQVVLEQTWEQIVDRHTGWWFGQQVDGVGFIEFCYYFAHVMDHFQSVKISNKKLVFQITKELTLSEEEKAKRHKSFCAEMSKLACLLSDFSPESWMIGDTEFLFYVEEDILGVLGEAANKREETNQQESNKHEKVDLEK